MQIRKKWQILNRLAALLDYAREHELATKLKPVLILMGMGICGVLAAAIWVPKWQVQHTPGTTAANYFDREDAARKTLAQIIGGIIIVGGFYVSFRTFGLSREGHLTDRFTKAIEQLGKTDGANPNIEVRVGAVYALERIAIDSPRDHWTIVEILTAYVRLNAPAAPDHPFTDGERPRADIQAILTVLGRRKTEANRELPSVTRYVDLKRTRLCGATLTGAKLQGADLEEAELQGSSLWHATLEGAALMKASLQQADLRGADVKGAFFFRPGGLRPAPQDGVDLYEYKYVTTEQIQSARNWHMANYSPAFRTSLELPPIYNDDNNPAPTHSK